MSAGIHTHTRCDAGKSHSLEPTYLVVVANLKALLTCIIILLTTLKLGTEVLKASSNLSYFFHYEFSIFVGPEI